jgi:hypothetical protein
MNTCEAKIKHFVGKMAFFKINHAKAFLKPKKN